VIDARAGFFALAASDRSDPLPGPGSVIPFPTRQPAYSPQRPLWIELAAVLMAVALVNMVTVAVYSGVL
jgi:hypothetical protein